MGDNTIGKIGAPSSAWKSAAPPQAKKEEAAQEIKDSFVSTAAEAEKVAKTKTESDPVSNAKRLINNALKHIDAAKPDLVEAKKFADEATPFLTEMDPHIKTINLDFIGRDVSAEGTSMRKIGDKYTGKVSEGESEVKEAQLDLKPVKTNVTQALEGLNKAGKGKSISSAKWELKNSLTWIDYANRDIKGSGRMFGHTGNSVKEMKPYLDIIEMDTVETDVGRFARDLKELKGDAQSQLLDAGLGAKFGGETLDQVKKYLNRALKYLG